MELLINESVNPAYNLALEEYFLVGKPRELVVLWRNDTSVIIGKNQNAQSEVDLDFTQKQNIPVIRRLSGGGAVFHDLGNINFSLINRLSDDDFSNYRKFTAPVCTFLKSKCLDVQLDGRNDLILHDCKFSGNAQAVKGEWLLSHGTLLYNADLSHLTAALKPSKAKIGSKGVTSIRSRVTNLYEHLPDQVPVEDFFNELAEFFLDQCKSSYQLTADDEVNIRDLEIHKYRTWEWNIGDSPEYDYSKTMRYPFGTLELSLNVIEGRIDDMALSGDFFGTTDPGELKHYLIGKQHRQETIAETLQTVDLEQFIHGMKLEDFLDLF